MDNPKPVACEFGQTCGAYPCAHRGLHLEGNECLTACTYEPRAKLCASFAAWSTEAQVVAMMEYIDERFRFFEGMDWKHLDLDAPRHTQKGTGIL